MCPENPEATALLCKWAQSHSIFQYRLFWCAWCQMSLCLSRNSDWHEIDEASPTKCASSASPSQTGSLQERIQLKSDIQRLPSTQLGQLAKLISNKEPTLNSTPKDLDVDIEKVKLSTVNASQTFVTARLQKSSLDQNDSKFSSSLL